MDVTEVRVNLTDENSDRLMAFCSITFDDMFVVRDIKIIDGPTGPFVAMPSRRLMSHCPSCKNKNHLKSNYCSECGRRLPEHKSAGESQQSRLYADIAHPINAECRELIQRSILVEFQLELDRSRQPGYVPKSDEDFSPVRSKRPGGSGPIGSKVRTQSLVSIKSKAMIINSMAPN